MTPPGPLNVFQRLARTWDAVHPYNAGQACRVAGVIAVADARAAWDRAVRSIGFDPGPGVDVLPRESDLAGHFTRELNRPFPPETGCPFRPFIQPADGSTWLGVVYRHQVADSVSIRELLRLWLAGPTADSGGSTVRLGAVPHRSRALVARWQGNWRFGETLLRLLRRYGDYRRVRKIHTFGPLEYPVRVRLCRTPPGMLPGLMAYARSRGVTVNDVCLAALAQACDRLVPAQERPGRDDVALSTVVDLRPGLGPRAGAGFGCLLGFTTTVCRRRELGDWDRLLGSVAAQSRSQRRAGVGPSSVLWMLAAELASRWTPTHRVYDFYRKEVPLAAGISNVNLNGTWAAADARVLDYVRVSPTGPVVPVALAVTSVGTELRLELTYRTALLNDWTATELLYAFVHRLQQLAFRGA